MKNFLKFLIKLIFVCLILLIGLDQLYTYVFQNSPPRSKIQNILQLKNKHYSYAFFGSSRTENHIDCELIEKLTGKSCINFGISGGTMGDMLVLMKLADQNNVTFDIAFLQVDYSYNGKGISNYFKAGLVPFLDNEIIRRQLSTDLESFSYSRIPFYRYMQFEKVVGFRELFNSVLQKKPNINLNIGFTPLEGVSQRIAGNLPSQVKEKNLELEEIKKLYEKPGTQLKLFSAPYCPKVKNREYFDSLEVKLEGLKNYSKIFDNKPDFFYNCGHLNINGAKKLTTIIIEDFDLK